MRRLRTSIAVAFIALAAVGRASAVYVSPEGIGQALIFPYYTAQSAGGNPFNTYVSVVNRGIGSKAVRVRFREGRNGREVAGFNLFLHAGDVWTGAVVPSGEGARLVTVDESCLDGPFVTDGGTPLVRHYDFANASYTGSSADGLGTGLDRTREGYIEMIEMAGLGTTSSAAVSPNRLVPGSTTPVNCAAVQGAAAASVQADLPWDDLSGTLTLINVAKGMDFTVNAVALAQLSSRPFFRGFADPYPDFDAGEVDPVSQFLVNRRSYVATWSNGLDAVASALMALTLGNETILDTATNSGTDWIVTQPLRRFASYAGSRAPTSFPPLANAGLPVQFDWQSREGSFMVWVNSCDILCPPNTYEVGPAIPWAATVISFAQGSANSAAPADSSTVLGSSNAVRWTLAQAAQNGAADIKGRNFSRPLNATWTSLADGTTGSASGQRIAGIPALGFMVRTFENGLLTCGGVACQGNYGGAFPHVSSRYVGP